MVVIKFESLMHIGMFAIRVIDFEIHSVHCTQYNFPSKKSSKWQPEEKWAQKRAYRYYERLQCLAVETVSEIRFKQ